MTWKKKETAQDFMSSWVKYVGKELSMLFDRVED